MYLIIARISIGEYVLTGYCDYFEDALSIADKAFENGRRQIK